MQKRPKKELEAFLEKYKHTYPRLHKVFDQAEPSLFQFYKFPEPIRYLYTTNLIERNNKGLKHTPR